MKLTLRFWRPLVRRYGAGVATLIIGASLLMGGGATYAALKLGGGNTGSIDLQSGLIAWWKLDGNGQDSTANNIDVTINGATPARDKSGNLNGAYAFDGVDDSISVGDHSLINAAGPYPQRTVSLWFKATNTANRQVLYEEGGTTRGLNIYLDAGTVYVNVWSFSAWGPKYVSAAVSANNWYNVVLVFSSDDNLVTGYLNGSSMGQVTGVTPLSSHTDDGGIGAVTGSTVFHDSTTSSSSYFTGTIDDVRLYDRLLTSAEASSLYSQYNTVFKIASDKKGLVGHWKLDGNTKDSSAYRNHGTISGTLTPTTDRKGKANGAYVFGGGYITAPDSPSLNIQGNQVTMSAWFKPSVDVSAMNNTYPTLIAKRPWQVGGYAAHFVRNNGEIIVQYCYTGTCPHASNGTPLTANTWYHYVGVVDGSKLYLYINGVLVKEVTASGVAIGSSAGSLFGIGQNFQGAIDDVRIYNRALSAEEVATQYNSYEPQINVGGSSTSGTAEGVNLLSGLVGRWDFAGNANDSSAYRNHGSASSVTVTSGHKGDANSAYNFNSGNSSLITIPATSSLSLPGDMTVSAWIKPSAATQSPFARIVTKYDGSKINYLLAYDGDPRMRFIVDDGSLNRMTAKSISDVNSTTNWYHVVAVRNSTGMYLYLNGSLEATVMPPSPANQINTSPLYIGGGVGNSFNGVIDDVRLYNRALSVAEVQALYQE